MWQYYYLMPKNIFTLSVVAIPVYTCIAVFLARSWHVVSSKTPLHSRTSVRRTALAVLLSAFTLHIIPALALVFILTANAYDGNPTISFRLLAGTYLWIGALIVSAQALVYYVPMRIVSFFAFKLAAGRVSWLPQRYSHTKTFHALRIALITSVALYVPFRTVHDATSIVRDTHVVPIPGLTEKLKLAIAADTQFDDFTQAARLNPMVSQINPAKPDLILFAGDLTTIDPADARPAGQVLARLAANSGKYAVLGDHDFWSVIDSTALQIRNAGFVLLENALFHIPVRQDTVNLIGLTNCLPARLRPEILDSLLVVPRAKGPTIVLVHDVKDWIVKRCSGHNVDLVVAGHTHGTQIAIDFFGYNLTSLLMDSRYTSGIYREGRTTVYVCNGVGTSVAPIRYNATPAYGIITLK